MISVVIFVVALALPFCSNAEEVCPQKFLRFSKDHSFCKPTNATCKYVAKSFPTKEEQAEIVKLHNMYRNQVALGQETLGGGLDSASNMLAISWDDELAEIAQKWAEQCLFEHDCGECRASSSFSVGQNMGLMMYPCTPGNCKPKQANWTGTVKMFYDEVGVFDKKLVKEVDFSGPMIGHFTQVIWAETYKVGCGYASYEEPFFGTEGAKQLTVCNYGPAGNLGRIYMEGPPCSKCPENSCCGESCNKEFPGLCFLSSYPPMYSKEKAPLYFCAFQENDPNCAFDSEGAEKWTLTKTAGGTFLSTIVQKGNTAVARFRQLIKVKRGACMNISLRKGPTVAGEKEDSSVDVEIENNGKKDLLSVWTYPWTDFITSPVEVGYDGEIKFSLKMTVPADAPPQYLEIKQIEITEEPCKYGK